MSQTMIGGSESKRQGPWPECLGLAASDCVHLIETNAEDVRGHVYVIDPDMMVTMDFRTDRVRVWVDESNVVIEIPKRG